MNDKKFIYQSLVISTFEDEQTFTLKFAGKSTEREPGRFITPILNDSIQYLFDKNKQLVLDFFDLEYMNSSTITPIIKFFDKIKKSKQQTLIYYNQSLRWQEMSFSALLVFMIEGLIEIQGK